MITVCYLCSRVGRTDPTYCHEHHIFPGKNRQASDKAGFVMYLCPRHHAEIHRSPKLMKWTQQQTQREYEQTHSREEFMKIIGRNYL